MLLTGGDEVVALANRLQEYDVISVDAEMDSFYSYQTKLCLIQISTPDEDFLVDPLTPVDLSPLRAPFENPHVLKLIHAADNDVPYLVERIGGTVGPIFDTHIAARVLGLPRAGLGGLLQEFLGIEVDKTFQRADWRLRPLPPKQVEYAVGDTRYLFEIYRRLLSMLQESSLLAEADSAFLRINQNPPLGRKFNPHAYLNLPEARKLSHFHKARLRDLFQWRDDLARAQDEAVFRVLPDGLLIPLSMFEGNAADLRGHFRHTTIQRHADRLSQVLERAAQQPFTSAEIPRAEPVLKGRQLRQFDQLRRWRNELAGALGVEPDRVITNRGLRSIVLCAPRNREELARVEGLEAWRVDKFGESLWAVAAPLFKD